MTTKEYQQLASRTDLDSEQYRTAGIRVIRHLRGLHAAQGLATEAGELVDTFKKHFFYGKELDEVNLMEETGDLLWYIALLCSHYGFSIEDAMTRNIEKLRARYDDKFTYEATLKRDLVKERAILEQRPNLTIKPCGCYPDESCNHCGGVGT